MEPYKGGLRDGLVPVEVVHQHSSELETRVAQSGLGWCRLVHHHANPQFESRHSKVAPEPLLGACSP